MLVYIVLCVSAVSARQIFKGEIVGGAPAPAGENYHQVLMNSGRCGGSLVRPDAVVSAAHCTVGMGATSLEFLINSESKSASGGIIERIRSRKIVNHPNYNDGSGGFVPNDISIVFLNNSVNYSHVIDMANAGDVNAGDICKITGWGRLYKDGPQPDALQETTGTILTTSRCKQDYGDSATSRNICINNENTGACNGDSGGPMTCWVEKSGKRIPVLAGVTSFGMSGCTTSYASVYTRVSTYKSWVENELSKTPQIMNQ